MSRIVSKVLNVLYPEDLQCPICEDYKMLNYYGVCKKCQDELKPCYENLTIKQPDFYELVAAYYYNETAKMLVNRHKLGYQRDLSKVFAKFIAEKLKSADTYYNSITWVPCTKAKKHYKGFDHAEDIAVELSKLLGVPAKSLLVKRRDSGEQKNRSREERLKYAECLFVCDCKVSVGGHILIVDDVITTGATMQGAAIALLKQNPGLIISGIATFYTPDFEL